MRDILEDTIAAISTPPGQGGIGIVRLSGQNSVPIVQGVFRSKSGERLGKAPSHTLSYGHIVCEGRVIDEVLVTVMRAPRTYTREDIVEINCHGGIIPLKRVLELVLAKGARLSEPGEFTKRAFLNGRIDLTQAEAVLDIISSKTKLSCDVALAQLHGRIGGAVEDIARKTSVMLADVEASIDFASEEISPPPRDELREDLLLLLGEIVSLQSRADMGLMLREGLKVSIIGRPNVGKSSLFNALLGRDRAIVTQVPGTTTDVVEETVEMGGIPVRVADTAGIVRSPVGVVEKEGVQRSLQSFRQADLLVVVIDGSEPLTEEDRRIIGDLKGKKSIAAINKCDLPACVDIACVEEIRGRNGVLMVSATENIGLDKLRSSIAGTVWQGEIDWGEQAIVTNVRHLQALRKAEAALRRALEGLDRAGEEVLCFDLREALESLGTIAGKAASEDILDQIFSRFCVGK